MIKYTEEQRQFIICNNNMKYAKELADMFNKEFNTNVTYKNIKSFRRNHRLDSGLTGQYQKGNIPMNKGKKWSEFMSEQGQANSLGTTFKKGNKSFNCDPIGTEKWKKHSKRNDEGFLYVKVQDGHKQYNWKQKHRLIWEEANGPIPKGHKVIFLDGDRQHIELSNLALVSNSQMLIMNKRNLIYKDQEATKSGIIVSKLIDTTNKIKKNK